MCESPFNTENPAYIILDICYDPPSLSSVRVVLATWIDDGDIVSMLNLRIEEGCIFLDIVIKSVHILPC